MAPLKLKKKNIPDLFPKKPGTEISWVKERLGIKNEKKIGGKRVGVKSRKKPFFSDGVINLRPLPKIQTRAKFFSRKNWAQTV